MLSGRFYCDFSSATCLWLTFCPFNSRRSHDILRGTFTGVIMTKMRAVQISEPNGSFEIVERDVPEPGVGMVRIKVHACGICHSDTLTKEGTFPGLSYPRVPGHEVVGVIDAVGEHVARWKAG